MSDAARRMLELQAEYLRIQENEGAWDRYGLPSERGLDEVAADYQAAVKDLLAAL